MKKRQQEELLKGKTEHFNTLTTFALYFKIRSFDGGSCFTKYGRLFAYPIMLYLVFIPLILDWFELFPESRFGLSCFSVIASGSLGMLNVLTYGLNRLREAYYRKAQVMSQPSIVLSDEDDSSFDEVMSWSIKDELRLSLNESANR